MPSIRLACHAEQAESDRITQLLALNFSLLQWWHDQPLPSTRCWFCYPQYLTGEKGSARMGQQMTRIGVYIMVFKCSQMLSIQFSSLQNGKVGVSYAHETSVWTPVNYLSELFILDVTITNGHGFPMGLLPLSHPAEWFAGHPRFTGSLCQVLLHSSYQQATFQSCTTALLLPVSQLETTKPFWMMSCKPGAGAWKGSSKLKSESFLLP